MAIICLWQTTGYAMAQKAVSVVDKINVMLVVEKQGDSALLTIEVANISPEKVNCTFLSAKKYDFIIKDAKSNIIWQWTHSRLFSQAIQKEFLDKGQVFIFSEKWDYKNNEGQRVTPGKYGVTGEFSVMPTSILTAPKEIDVLEEDLKIAGGYTITGTIAVIGSDIYINSDDGVTYKLAGSSVDFKDQNGDYIAVFSPVIQNISGSQYRSITIKDFKVYNSRKEYSGM